MSAPLLVAILLLASLAVAGCGKSSGRRACAPPSEPELEALRDEALDSVCDWQDRAHLPEGAVAGAKVFATSGCLSCHTYLGDGSHNVGGSDLSAAGLRWKVRDLERFVADPSRFGNRVMPKFRALGPKKLRQVAVFLAASRGSR